MTKNQFFELKIGDICTRDLGAETRDLVEVVWRSHSRYTDDFHVGFKILTTIGAPYIHARSVYMSSVHVAYTLVQPEDRLYELAQIYILSGE